MQLHVLDSHSHSMRMWYCKRTLPPCPAAWSAHARGALYCLEAWEWGQHLTCKDQRWPVHTLQWYNDTQLWNLRRSNNYEMFRIYFRSIAAACHELCHFCMKLWNPTGSGRSTVLFSSAHSRLTLWVPLCCASMARSTHGLISAFVPVERPLGTNQPKILSGNDLDHS